jgi:hypothetical protein
MKTPLATGEAIVKEGAANYLKRYEGVGGKLYLTTERLIFESHAFNIHTGVTIILLRDVIRIEPSWTKLLNLIPVMPNSMKVFTGLNKLTALLFMVEMNDQCLYQSPPVHFTTMIPRTAYNTIED